MNYRRLFLPALVMGGALLIAACGTAQAEPAPSTEAGPALETVVPETVAANVAPEVTSVPTDQPDEAPEQAEAVAPAPKVLWFRSSHAGPGVVTLRFETDTPTTATVRVMTNQVGPAAFYTEDLDDLATNHIVSVPANAFGRYQVRVENQDGIAGWGELRYLKDAAGVDWATGANAPTLKALSAKKLEVNYAFPAGHSSKLGFDGLVRVFSTAASCTTADSCPGDPVGLPVASDAAGNGQLETHTAALAVPGSAFNYQVLVGQPLNENSTTMIFMQLEVRGDQLPKTNFEGPGSITR